MWGQSAQWLRVWTPPFPPIKTPKCDAPKVYINNLHLVRIGRRAPAVVFATGGFTSRLVRDPCLLLIPSVSTFKPGRTAFDLDAPEHRTFLSVAPTPRPVRRKTKQTKRFTVRTPQTIGTIQKHIIFWGNSIAENVANVWRRENSERPFDDR